MTDRQELEELRRLDELEKRVFRGQTTEQRQASVLAQKAKQFGAELTSAFQEQYAEPIYKMATGDISGGAKELGQSLAPGVRMAGMAAPAFFTGGATIAPQAARTVMQMARVQSPNQLLPFISGYSSEIAGQALAGEQPSAAKATEAGILTSYLPGQTRFAEGEIAKFFPQLAKNVAREGLSMAATQTAATTARRSIESGRFETYKDLTDALSDLQLPVGITAALAPVQAYGDVARTYERATQKARNEMVSALGVDAVTLANINPAEYGAIEQRLTQQSPQLLKRIMGQYGNFTEAMQKIFGSPADPAALAKSLNPYVGTLEKKRADLALANREVEEAQRQLEIATNSGGDPKITSALRNRVFQAGVDRTRKQAVADFYSDLSQKTSGVIKGSDEILTDFSGAFDKIMEARKTASRGLYDEFYRVSGIAPDSPQIPVSSVIADARKALKDSGRSGPLADDVINSIESFAKSRDLTSFSIEDIRALRTSMSDTFAGQAPDRLNAAEAIASIAYGGVTNSLNRSIDGLATSQNNPLISESWKRAQNYWRSTSQTLSSPYGKALMQPDQRAATFKTLSNQIAAGDKTAVNSWKEFVESVAVESPEVAAWGVNAMNQAIRDSFILNAMEGGRLSIPKLNRNLANAASTGFDTSKVGFGTRDQLLEIQSLLDDFNPSGASVSPDVLFNLLNNKIVQNSMLTGKSIKESARPIVARQVLLQNLKNDMLKSRLGIKSEAAANIGVYDDLAKRAQMTRDDLVQEIQKMQGDELFVALEGKSLGLPGRPGETSIGITRAIMSMDSSDAKQVMTALKNRMPEIYPKVESRIITDSLQEILVPSKIPGRQWEIDPTKYLQFFRPRVALDPQAPVNRLRNILGKDSFERLEKLMGGLSNLQKAERASGGITRVSDPITGAAILRSSLEGSPSGGSLIIASYRKLMELAENGKYHIISHLVTSPNFSKVYFGSGGVLSSAVKSGIGQRVFSNLPEEVKMEWSMSSSQDTRKRINNR